MSLDSESKSELNCETFEDRIHQILDDRLTLTGDPLLMDHASQCAPCESILLEYDAVDDSMKILKEDMNEILSRVDSRNQKRSFTQRPLAVLGTLAAALLVFVSAFNTLQPKTNNNPTPISPKSVAKKVSTLKPAPLSGTLSIGAIKPMTTRVYRPTPDTSPFSPNFKVANTIPRIPTAENWSEVTSKLETLEPVLTYSKELPGVQVTKCSIAVTIELLRKSLTTKPPTTKKPDLGWTVQSELSSMA